MFLAVREALTNTKTNPIRSHFASRTSGSMKDSTKDLWDGCIVVFVVVIFLGLAAVLAWYFSVASSVVGLFRAICDKPKALLQRCSTRAGAGTTTSGGGTAARTTTGATTE